MKSMQFKLSQETCCFGVYWNLLLTDLVLTGPPSWTLSTSARALRSCTGNTEHNLVTNKILTVKPRQHIVNSTNILLPLLQRLCFHFHAFVCPSVSRIMKILLDDFNETGRLREGQGITHLGVYPNTGADAGILIIFLQCEIGGTKRNTLYIL